jgi:hypothetical protein
MEPAILKMAIQAEFPSTTEQEYMLKLKEGHSKEWTMEWFLNHS